MRRRKLFPPAFLLLLLLSFPREGTSQNSTTSGTEDYVTDVYIITETAATTTAEYTTEAPATTTAEYTTEAPATTTAEYTTEAPATTTAEYTTETPATTTAEYTTETPANTGYITEIYNVTENYTTTEEYTTEVSVTTTTTESSETTVTPSRTLEPWAIVLISLAAAAVLIGLCVGLGCFLKKILHLRSPFSADTYHPHDPNCGLNHGLSGLQNRGGWKKATASTTTMEMGGGHNMPSAC